jgi:hypothetical protein
MKKFLIIIISFLVVLLSFFFYQNSDSVKIKEAIKTINTFAITTELESENFFEIYPSLNGIGRFNYWKLIDLKIENEKIFLNSNDEITIPCIFSDSKKAIFIISKKNTGEIMKSKGFLSNNEYLCQYLDNIRAINHLDYDVSIHNSCKRNEKEFESIVNGVLKKTIDNITMEKGSKMTNSYNIHSSGVIVIKNNNPIDFTNGDIQLYCNFYNRKKELISREELFIISTPLPKFSTRSYEIYSAPVSKTYNLSSEINRDFIKKYVSENARGSNGYYSFNL